MCKLIIRQLLAGHVKMNNVFVLIFSYRKENQLASFRFMYIMLVLVIKTVQKCNVNLIIVVYKK